MSPIISSTITSAVVYLYPSYATFKSLRHEPGAEQDADKWLAYWCIIGAFVAFEASLEWLIRWFPFYTEIKTLFLVFLSQGGSGFVYKELLAPRYALYEPQIDAHLAAFKTRTMEYIRDNIQAFYDFVFRTISDVGRGLASDALNTYGAGLLATGAGYFGGAGSPAPQDPKRSAPASPSANESSGAHPSAASEGYSLNGDL
ncbi:hypothetical protein BS47DRAFT_1349468 [Hydnum rufescens UP504]|uniref:Protein YOP1 n=1 Tax=Hydnum rufescens UP504 TaxID=1448309 RepID=A0A9P6DS72_9AGAM|nr:hypothetical protein BS47DRAFT_1349468 [Hydnum rufescens UP504]